MSMEIRRNKKHALVLGATGLVGSELLSILLDSPHYEKIRTLSRSPIKIDHPKHDGMTLSFDELDQKAACFRVHDVFCALGTTIKKAGSKADFRKVDFDYCYQSAKIARQNGVAQFLLVSSVGADSDSLFFYSRVKGEIEEAVRGLGFWATHIFRPSLLLGDRKESRPVEAIARQIGSGLNPIIGSWLGDYQPVQAKEVALAMHNAAQKLKPGIHYYTSKEMNRQLKEIE